MSGHHVADRSLLGDVDTTIRISSDLTSPRAYLRSLLSSTVLVVSSFSRSQASICQIKMENLALISRLVVAAGRSPWRSSWRSWQVCSWGVLVSSRNHGQWKCGDSSRNSRLFDMGSLSCTRNAMRLGRPEKFSFGTWRHLFGVIDTSARTKREVPWLF